MKKIKKELFITVPVLLLAIVFGTSIPLCANISDKMEGSASRNLISATYVIENSMNTRLQNDRNALQNSADSCITCSAENMELFCCSSGFIR